MSVKIICPKCGDTQNLAVANGTCVVCGSSLDSSAGSALTWYTPEELRHYLQRNDYAPNIANELAADYAANLQKAFDKGFEMGQRKAQNDQTEPRRDTRPEKENKR